MDEPIPHDALPLRTVSRMTGLSPDIIRAWEKRYGVVAPSRGARGARLYSAADVAHLRLLRQVVGAGRAIGDVARLPKAELQALAGPGAATAPADVVTAAARIGAPAEVVTQALAALQAFDAGAIDRTLGDALVALGARAFVRQVASPLLCEVGERWADGRVSIAEEHLLTGLLRNLLGGLLRTRGPVASPTVLLATPAGERHEFGLLVAALLVADAGLGLCYLGTDLPAAEVAAAARRSGAEVVGLGVVNDDNHRTAVAEVRRVERELAPAVELWLGGRGAAAVAAQITDSRAVVLDQIAAMESELARVRALGTARV